MRRLLVLLVACSNAHKPASEPVPPSPGVEPVLSNHPKHTCTHAARGLAGATRGVRSPDTDVFDELLARCDRDGWSVNAIDCFSVMNEGDLGTCAKLLDERQREATFSVLAGNEPSQAGLFVARARLQQLSVGIDTCDRFVNAVTTLLGCDGLSIEMRLQLGNETAQFWSLPTDRLGAADRQRMSQVCVDSLQTLARETAPVGCAL
jgi:hypothetical protein